MTVRKREFEAIAKSIQDTRSRYRLMSADKDPVKLLQREIAIRQVALDLLVVLKRLNKKFEEGKFMEVVDGKVKSY